MGVNKPTIESMFIREVPVGEFITGIALASQIGLTAGTTIADAGWLHFEDTVDGLTKYISKRPLRHSISWDSIHAVGAVFGTRTVVVNGETYKVRLLSGANTDPATGSSGFDAQNTHGSEWNRLMYWISAKPFGDSSNTLQSEGITVGNWASYSEADLLMHYNHGDGSYQWCQETGTAGNQRVLRGYFGVSYSGQNASTAVTSVRGWRVCLELVRD